MIAETFLGVEEEKEHEFLGVSRDEIVIIVEKTGYDNWKVKSENNPDAVGFVPTSILRPPPPGSEPVKHQDEPTEDEDVDRGDTKDEPEEDESDDDDSNES